MLITTSCVFAILLSWVAVNKTNIRIISLSVYSEAEEGKPAWQDVKRDEN
jgi:hypothetical protein